MDRGNPMPPPTDRKPGPALFLDGAATQQHLLFPPEREAHSLRPFVGFACPQKHWPFLFAPPIQRACLSPQGDFMLYSTVPQPVDEDLVQRLREKGGL